MPEAQIENSQGAFGYLTTVNTPPTPLHSQKVRRFRNMSTATGIPRGAAVVQAATTSTAAGVNDLSTVDEGCFLTTVIGDPRFIGVTLTSCAARTTGSTVNAPAPSSQYVDVCVEGPVYGALLATAATAPVAGSVLTIGSATVSGGSTVGFAFGGTLTVLDTVSITSAGAAVLGVAGWCITPGTTGTTGFLTTIGNRGVIWVGRSICMTTRSTA